MGGPRKKLAAPKRRSKAQRKADAAAALAPAEVASDPVQAQIDTLIARAITHLDVCLTSVEETVKAGDASPAVLRESGTVARGIIGLAAELRQQQRHQARMVAAMSPEEQDRLVVAYISDLPKQRRAEIRRLLDDLDDAEGVL